MFSGPRTVVARVFALGVVGVSRGSGGASGVAREVWGIGGRRSLTPHGGVRRLRNPRGVASGWVGLGRGWRGGWRIGLWFGGRESVGRVVGGTDCRGRGGLGGRGWSVRRSADGWVIVEAEVVGVLAWACGRIVGVGGRVVRRLDGTDESRMSL